MGSEMRDADSKSTVNASRTPLRSGESAASGRSGCVAARERGAEPATLRRMDHREIGRRVHGDLVEDGSEGSLQSFDGGAAQTLPPPAVDDGWEVGPDRLRPASGLRGAHRGLVLWRVPQGPAVRRRDRDVPPTAQAAQEKLIGAGPRPEIRHGDSFAADVLQDVGPQGERHQPRPTGPCVGFVVPSGPMRQAVLRLVVELDRVRHQSL